MIGTSPWRPATCRSHVYGSGFHGSPVEPMMRSDERSCFAGHMSPCGLSARISVGETPSMFTRWCVTLFQSRSGSGKSGAPSYITIVAPRACEPIIENGPMIQPMSVNQ